MKRIFEQVINEAAQAARCTIDDLTVPDCEADPYRLDTPSGHLNGEWLADQRHLLTRPVRHVSAHSLLALHDHMVANARTFKPNGAIYKDTDWEWLSKTVAPAARWLGYIGFAPSWTGENTPVTRENQSVRFWPSEFESSDQPYQLAILGEEHALGDVALPIAEHYSAYLSLGLRESIIEFDLYSTVEHVVWDLRARAIIICTDCTPSGDRRLVSIARKFQALRDRSFPDLQFQIIPVTPRQVKTEITTLAALSPDVLQKIIIEAIRPYFDESLDRWNRPPTTKIRATPTNVLISSDMPWVEATRALRRRLGVEA